MARSFYISLLLATVPWITVLWVLKILHNLSSCMLILAVSGMLALVYQCHIYPVYTTPFRSLPTLKGRSYWLGNHSRAVKPMGQDFPRLCTEFRGEQIVRFYTFLSVEAIFVVGPEAISDLCLQQSDKFSHSKTLELLTEVGLGYAGFFGVRGEAHKRFRKLVAPMFSPGSLAQTSVPLWQSCVEMAHSIDPDTTSLDIEQWASISTLKLAGTYVLGQDAEWLARYPDLRASLDRRIATGRFKTLVLAISPQSIRSLLMLTLLGSKEFADLRYLEQFARDLIQDGRRKLPTPVKPTSPPNIISLLLQDATIHEDEILGHILGTLVAATETISASFQWTILELCRHPAIQTRLREELLSAGSSQITTLPYLRAVVDEVFRLHPSVGLTQHEATQDTILAGVPIPRGTLLLCPPLAANLHPRFWGPDAAVFNPDRWQQQKPIGQNPCAIMTFSAGPRNCPGRSMARLMLSCLTAALIRRYQVSLKDTKQVFEPSEAAHVKPVPALVVRLRKVA